MGNEAAVLKSITGEPLALLGVAARGKVAGLLFELTVEQQYRNNTTTNIEAVYTFPLPHGAVLLDLHITLGEKTLTGVIVEKRAAEEQYEEAIDKGNTAIMLERAGDGLLTLNLGNLMAGESATIRYRYAQLLRFDHGSVRLTVPTVIAPRYGDPASAGLQPHQTPTSDLLVAYPFSLSVELEGAIAAGTLASATHAINVVNTAKGKVVSLNTAANLDRDFVLTVADIAGKSLAIVGRDGDGYVALASFCPEVAAQGNDLPLRLKLLLDCSGSMAGDSIEAARRALHRVLESMTPADCFSFSRFGSSVHHEMPRVAAADATVIRAASTCVARAEANLGGTEMEGALQSVFALEGAEGNADVLLITDGEIWGADSLIAEARNAHQRVFVVGIGSAPAEGVLRRLAEATGGACEFVAPNEDAEAAILRMFARLREPRVAGAEIAWPMSPQWTTALPQSLFGGETINVCAGFTSQRTGDVTLRLLPRKGADALTTLVTLGAAVTEDATLARMAAALRMQTADEKTRLELALRYSLVTDQTNLLVVHERAEGDKAQELPTLSHVPQMLAAGWGGTSTMLRAGRSAAVMCASIDSLMDASDSMTFHAGLHELPLLASPSLRARDKATPYDDAAIPESLDDFLKRLDKSFSSAGVNALPASLADLVSIGIPLGVLNDLEDLVAAGNDERSVVLALLQALEPRARELGLSRHLLREIRHAMPAAKADDALMMATTAAVTSNLTAVARRF